jgi:hypothetical protein
MQFNKLEFQASMSDAVRSSPASYKFTPFVLDCWKATNHKSQPIDYNNYI